MASRLCVSLGICGVLSVALALPATGADSKSSASKSSTAKKTKLAENLRPFDKNNDGIIDAAERKAMNAAKKAKDSKGDADLNAALGVDKEGHKVDSPPPSRDTSGTSRSGSGGSGSGSGGDGERRRFGPDPNSEIGKFFTELRAKVDTNGDGQLDEDERAAMGQEIEKAREAGTLPEGFGRGFGRGPGGGPGGSGGGRPPMFDPNSPVGKFFADIRSKVDKDGDGELNEDERQAMRDEIDKARQSNSLPEGFPDFSRFRGRGGPGGGGYTPSKETLEKFDKDGDGKLNEDERAAMRADWEKNRGSSGGGYTPSAETLKKFDKDGDGKLNDDERAAMRADWEKNRGSRGGSSRDGGSRDSSRRDT